MACSEPAACRLPSAVCRLPPGMNLRQTHERNAQGPDAFRGGHSGYFSDPDGYLWEMAWGAFEFNADGSLKIT